ncbi:MAG: sulfatase-like hydrolase/transferase [Planctomycetales bacterium]|nr:sulfatase-like hydrolase/transferase [Planctomycetales bacterium]
MRNALILAALIGCVASDVSLAALPKRPNFVIFITDDQPYIGLSCTGNPILKTPHLDELAERGVLFDNAFVTTAICCCSRASILTGQHMRRNGIRDFKTPLSREQWQQTFPALLRKAGYRTAFLGKFAVGQPFINEQLALPDDQFDFWYGFPQSIAFKQVVDGRDRYLTTVMEEKASEFLGATNSDQPFCLIVALKEPHGPLDFFDPEYADPYGDALIPRPVNLTRQSFDKLPAKVREGLNGSPGWIDNPESYQSAMRKVYAYLSRADLAVGRICDAVAMFGFEQNTVVIHLSDHGSLDGAHGLSGKWLMYEESIHIPLIICDPRVPAARGRRSQMALNIDLAPTILAMADVPIPEKMQGTDLRPILADSQAAGREDWYYEHVYNTEDDRKRIPPSEGVRTKRWKYIRYTEQQPPLEQLFDLQADPHEDRDLSDDPDHSLILSMLQQRCDHFRQTLE